ncbi:MAG: Mrp/NBP35 family ATP-binding protein [Firmicutes bacterium]|nr:Mrp/NBP35 family ATP-binding protein [Bacillota bacterium]
MAQNCDHNCEHCAENCADRTSPESFLEPANKQSNIKKVIGVVSGKGGVGKSLVTSMLASAMAKGGRNVAILDADLTGPSIPKMFGLKGIVGASEEGIIPAVTENGIKVMSVNLMLPSADDPVVWRGPVIAGVVKQFWSDVIWGDIDYMFVDMPPGTGDVPLTVFQSLPVSGIVVVTSPQDLVGMIVGKAVKMAALMNIPVIGVVENMSYFQCPDCGSRHYIFGKSRLEELAEEYGILKTARLPLDPAVAAKCDEGRAQDIDTSELEDIVAACRLSGLFD